MTLNEIFNTEPTKMKVICFAKDGNTVVKHYEDCYHIVGNYYVCKKPNQYGGIDANFIVHYPATGYALIGGYVPEQIIDDDRYDWANDVNKFVRYKDSEAEFVKQMDNAVEWGTWITMVEINMLDLIFKTCPMEEHDSITPYLEHRKRCKEKQEEEERRREEKERAEEIERKRYAEIEHQKMLKETERILKKGGVRINPEVEYVLELAERYGVPFPPRVKSWYRKNRPAIRIDNGKFGGYYYRHGSNSHSKSFGDYVDKLLDAINANS